MPSGGVASKPNFSFQSNHGNDVTPVEQVPGGYRRVLADGNHMMIIEWRMADGVVVPLHQHRHEQSGYVVSGQMIFSANGKEHSLTPGMGYLVRGNEPHAARFPVASVIVDIFSPPREDYRSLTAEGPSYMTGTMKAKAPARKKPVASRKKVAAQKRSNTKRKK